MTPFLELAVACGILAFIFVVLRQRGKNAEQRLRVAPKKRETSLSIFLKDNIRKGPKWLVPFHAFVASITIAGSITGILLSVVGVIKVVWEIQHYDGKTHVIAHASMVAVLYIYTAYFHPVVTGLFHNYVMARNLPGFKAALQRYYAECDAKRAR